MKKYTIKAGQHYSFHLPKLYVGKKDFKITCQFTESCRYDLGTIDQLDINKLAGISFGYHEINSIRIGWNYNWKNNKIDLYWYIYEDGFRRYGKIDSCEIGEVKEIELLLLKDSKEFYIKTNNANLTVNYRYPELLIGYYLFPYFGGEPYPAPHDVELYMSFN